MTGVYTNRYNRILFTMIKKISSQVFFLAAVTTVLNASSTHLVARRALIKPSLKVNHLLTPDKHYLSPPNLLVINNLLHTHTILYFMFLEGSDSCID